MRIVSLLPSSTEIICALGLKKQLVGVTHECDYPEAVRDLPSVTRSLIPTAGTSAEIDELVRENQRTNAALYSLDRQQLAHLQPDLIVTQTLCSVCAVAEDEVSAAVAELPYSPLVLNLEPQTLADVFSTIRQVAKAASVEHAGDELTAQLTARVEQVAARNAHVVTPARVTVLEWLDPPFSCGHWTPELVRLAGGHEGLARRGERSRALRWTEIIDWAPEVVFVACCGFDVDRTLSEVSALDEVQGWRGLPAVRAGRVYVTDGSQYFSRPGPRLVDSIEILAHTLHPDVHPLPTGVAPAICLDRWR